MSDAGDRLARTRLALIEHVYRRKHGGDYEDHRAEAARAGSGGSSSRREGGDDAARQAHGEYEQARRHGNGWFASFKRAAGVWWRHHPAHMGVEIATPLLSAYAARRPVVYLGAAAAIGALVVCVRPWRLISTTGLLLAIVKSSQLSNMVMSAISAAQYDADDPPYR